MITTTDVVGASPDDAAALLEVSEFGPNPSRLKMRLYVPDTVAERPAVLVAMHNCTCCAATIFFGAARDYVTGADRYGYVVVFPESTRPGRCFDVYTRRALRRGGGSDPVGIVSMVRYALARYDGDPDRVYATGFSSGAMMTNVLAAEYPDVFAAGAAFMGVPAGSFATTGGVIWNDDCAEGQVIRTPRQWGEVARAMYPGYAGRYPRMQLWHGTADDVLRYPNFGEEIKQWTHLHGVRRSPEFTDRPQPGWTRTRYGDDGTRAPVEAISVERVGHSLPLPGMVACAIDFFGLSA